MLFDKGTNASVMFNEEHYYEQVPSGDTFEIFGQHSKFSFMDPKQYPKNIKYFL